MGSLAEQPNSNSSSVKGKWADVALPSRSALVPLIYPWLGLAMRIAVLIDEDGNILSAHGPFSSSEELRVWAETSLKKAARVEWWRYQDVRLVGVTDNKG